MHGMIWLPIPASGVVDMAGSIHETSYGYAPNTEAALASQHYGWIYGNYETSTSAYAPQVAITKNGRMIIGASLIADNPMTYIYTAHNYGLYVQDGILSEHVRVSIHTTENWNDQVFDNDYTLMSLPKLEKYLHTNRHLPDMPSADEVVKDGIDIAEIDSKLLKK